MVKPPASYGTAIFQSDAAPEVALIFDDVMIDIETMSHEPIYDCIAQAWQVWSHYQER